MKPSNKKSKIKNQKSKVIILMGPPGSGKGTQAKLLAQKFSFKYFGAGDILRQRQKKSDFTAQKLKEVMNRGELAPSFVVVNVFGDELEQFQSKKIKGLVLDGWTRILVESQLVDEAINWYGWGENLKVILIKISSRASFLRLTKRRQCKKCGQLIPWVGEFRKLKVCPKCGGELVVRPDDNIQSIKKRLEEYNRQTKKVINYYRKQGRLIEINGEQSIEDVFQDILKALQ